MSRPQMASLRMSTPAASPSPAKSTTKVPVVFPRRGGQQASCCRQPVSPPPSLKDHSAAPGSSGAGSGYGGGAGPQHGVAASSTGGGLTSPRQRCGSSSEARPRCHCRIPAAAGHETSFSSEQGIDRLSLSLEILLVVPPSASRNRQELTSVCGQARLHPYLLFCRAAESKSRGLEGHTQCYLGGARRH
jgi:hypothetical protein